MALASLRTSLTFYNTAFAVPWLHLAQDSETTLIQSEIDYRKQVKHKHYRDPL